MGFEVDFAEVVDKLVEVVLVCEFQPPLLRQLSDYFEFIELFIKACLVDLSEYIFSLH